jgi:hypothetical protein
MIVVEHGIVCKPRIRKNGGNYEKYPWNTMNIGDSFWLPLQTLEERGVPRRAATAYRSRHPGWNFYTRQEENEGIVGIRFWRGA